MSGVEPKRLDLLLVERGLAPSRARAAELVRAGRVSVDGSPAAKPALPVPPSAALRCARDEADTYASRGARKLLAALERFPVSVGGRVALDAGASTGGFTDVLLRLGAPRVYAVDVGHGQLIPRLRMDRRVVVMERTNIRHVPCLPERPGLVVADLSFIPLTLVLPRLAALAAPDAAYLLLVKPQFEAGRRWVGGGGIVRDPRAFRAALESVAASAADLGLGVCGVVRSPLRGASGNNEFLMWLERARGADAAAAIADALEATRTCAARPEGAPS